MIFFKKNKKEENIAKFEKVSYGQFKKDWEKLFGETDENILIQIFKSIKLPVRSTEKSAGYDFFAPFGFTMGKDDNIVIPTGIRVKLNDDKYLAIHPRSSMGFKYRVALANTTGIIDADYYDADNEGHIMIKLCYDDINPSCKIGSIENDGNEIMISTLSKRRDEALLLVVKQSDRFAQGIINTYGTTKDDEAIGKRTGGEGSTGK